MTKETIKNALIFMSRANMKAEEALAYLQAKIELEKELKKLEAKDTPEKTNKKK